jgi:hypothetical protein
MDAELARVGHRKGLLAKLAEGNLRGTGAGLGHQRAAAAS